MSLEDLESYENIILFDSFQLYNLILNLEHNHIDALVTNKLSENDIITVYYRVPTVLKRKLFKSSIKVKSAVRAFEIKHGISWHFEPVMIFNLLDLKSDIMANKIKEHGYLLDFFIKDFVAIQNAEGEMVGVLYLHDMINLINDKKFRINNTYAVIINHTIKRNKIINTIDDPDSQLINCNYFIVKAHNDNIIGAVNIDYILDDFYLVQDKDSDAYTFYLYMQQKALDVAAIFITSVISTCLIGLLSAILKYHPLYYYFGRSAVCH